MCALKGSLRDIAHVDKVTSSSLWLLLGKPRAASVRPDLLGYILWLFMLE